jgi:Flp pilus assembly protein TadG
MKFRTKLRREDGAAAVEFALIVGVLAMLVFGMLQFGVAFFQLQNLRAAAREGARVGSVGATVSQVKAQTSVSSLGSLPANSGAVDVYYSDNPSVNGWGTPLATTVRSCPTKDKQTDESAVRVNVNLKSAALPAALKDIFVVDIPLMPPIPLTGAQIDGVFRCEGN